jgi:hypothetical protein
LLILLSLVFETQMSDPTAESKKVSVQDASLDSDDDDWEKPTPPPSPARKEPIQTHAELSRPDEKTEPSAVTSVTMSPSPNTATMTPPIASATEVKQTKITIEPAEVTAAPFEFNGVKPLTLDSDGDHDSKRNDTKQWVSTREHIELLTEHIRYQELQTAYARLEKENQYLAHKAKVLAIENQKLKRLELPDGNFVVIQSSNLRVVYTLEAYQFYQSTRPIGDEDVAGFSKRHEIVPVSKRIKRVKAREDHVNEWVNDWYPSGSNHYHFHWHS